MRRFLCVLVLLILVACGASGISTQQAYERLRNAGLATNGRTAPNPGEGAIFIGCTDAYAFDIPNHDQATSVLFRCPRDVGDMIMARPSPTPESGILAGVRVVPYVYRSAGGAILVSVSALSGPQAAERIRAEIALIPD